MVVVIMGCCVVCTFTPSELRPCRASGQVAKGDGVAMELANQKCRRGPIAPNRTADGEVCLNYVRNRTCDFALSMRRKNMRPRGLARK